MRHLTLLLALVAGVSACSAESHAPPDSATVVEVIDGDTAVVEISSRRETVRFLGVDTPETKHPEKPVECFGPEAEAFTRSLLPPGTELRLERDVEARDRYDRLLVYVHRVEDGLFVNRELVEQGYAEVLVIEPNTAYESTLRAAASRARAERRGLWSACGSADVPAGS